MSLSVRLAGFNIDADLLKDLLRLFDYFEQEASSVATGKLPPSEAKQIMDTLLDRIHSSLNHDAFTPETISAAYARISRDPNPISELRKSARQSVARSRKSNESIIFGLGHTSVAEHACFNFDVIGLSRLAAEELQSHRLLSFTEKSQRYITIDSDFIIPVELQGTEWEDRIRPEIAKLFAGYQSFSTALLSEHKSKLTEEPSKNELRDLETQAKEDARYLLPLACASQMGVTINARNLEYVVCCFSDHPLTEIRDLGKALYKSVASLAPSLVKYTTRGSYPRENYSDLRESMSAVAPVDFAFVNGPTVRLIDSTPEAELKVINAFGFSLNRSPHIAPETIAAAYSTVFHSMGQFDTSPRELELAQLTFEAELSASCFAQLKRHRMMTILSQSYLPSIGAVIPPSIRDIGMADEFSSLIQSATALSTELYAEHPTFAPYLLTNAHKKRVLLHLNARELYHISRLRCDEHAQWEIRDLAQQMLAIARTLWPNIFILACGKHEFETVYYKTFGETIPPK